jgi:molecular chaperone GrpE (heat shock protein)
MQPTIATETAAAAKQRDAIPPEFLIDEEPEEVGGDLRAELIALLREVWQMRRKIRDMNLTREEEMRREGEFLKQILAVKERKCDQFVAVERARSAAADGADPAARAETERWVHRLESLQQAFDATLVKHGVTRYEPSGRAIPERDDVKDTEAGTGQTPGTIVRILKPSYLWHGAVLRPAEVIVAE